jgi:hypothetical protein
LITPHPPYIFDRHGGVVPRDELPSPEGGIYFDNNHFYLDQLVYISTVVLELVDEILESSESRPIIILQADHGPDFGLDWADPKPGLIDARTAILNTYLLPPTCQETLYPAITPVNSFRVVLNCAFSADLDLLPDRTYFSNIHSHDRGGPFEFIQVRFPSE